MRRMKALVGFPYRGRQIAAGEEFDADDEHVGLFEKIDHARVMGHTYSTRMMTADTRGKRRKDMRIDSD